MEPIVSLALSVVRPLDVPAFVRWIQPVGASLVRVAHYRSVLSLSARSHFCVGTIVEV